MDPFHDDYVLVLVSCPYFEWSISRNEKKLGLGGVKKQQHPGLAIVDPICDSTT